MYFILLSKKYISYNEDIFLTVLICINVFIYNNIKAIGLCEGENQCGTSGTTLLI